MADEETLEKNEEEAIKSQKNSQKSVMNYLLVLFAAAFCLLLLTLLMEQRTNDEIVDKMYEQVGLAQSNHSQMSVELEELEDALTQTESDMQALQDNLAETQSQLESARDDLKEAESASYALDAMLQSTDWLSEIEFALADGDEDAAKSLVLAFEATDLVDRLPLSLFHESENESFLPPRDRYAAIVNELFPDGLPSVTP